MEMKGLVMNYYYFGEFICFPFHFWPTSNVLEGMFIVLIESYVVNIFFQLHNIK